MQELNPKYLPLRILSLYRRALLAQRTAWSEAVLSGRGVMKEDQADVPNDFILSMHVDTSSTSATHTWYCGSQWSGNVVLGERILCSMSAYTCICDGAF